MSCALKSYDALVFVTPQDVEGVVNANPEFIQVRRTDGRITQQNTFEKSSELKSNLQGQKNTLTDVAYSNSVSIEVTQNLLVFAKSVLMNSQVAPVAVSDDTISFDASARTITAVTADAFATVNAGQWIWVSGSNKVALNTAYYVVTKTSNTELIVANVSDDDVAGDTIVMTGTMLRSGNTPQLLTVQGRDTHTGATDDTDYRTQIDAVVDTLSIAVPQTGILTGSATVIAATQLPTLEPISGQTDAPVDDSNVLGSAMDFKGFFPNGFPTENNFADITIDIVRNTGIQNVAGKLGAKCVAQDVIGITGTLTSLRKAADPAEEESKFDNSERFAMSVGFEWEDGSYLMITMRRMIYTDGSIASATGEFANFAGTYDAEEDEYGTTIQFDTNMTVPI